MTDHRRSASAILVEVAVKRVLSEGLLLQEAMLHNKPTKPAWIPQLHVAAKDLGADDELDRVTLSNHVLSAQALNDAIAKLLHVDDAGARQSFADGCTTSHGDPFELEGLAGVRHAA